MAGSKMRRITVVALALVALAGGARADDNGPEARLRAALKTATARIRELEDQNAQLQAKQAAAERDRLEFTQKAAAADKELEALHKQGEATWSQEQPFAEITIEPLRAQRRMTA